MQKIIRIITVIGIFITFCSFGVSVRAEDNVESKETEGNIPTYSVDFYLDGVCIKQDKCKSGEKVTPPTLSVKAGYELVGWSIQKNGEELFDFNTLLHSDVKLYAVYKLLPPIFSITTISFVYDGLARCLELENLTHPLKNEGRFEFEWYKNGVAISKFGNRVYVKNVSDSGDYVARITFYVNGDKISVTTPSVSVDIKKSEIPLPEIKSKVYTGEHLFPDVETGVLYTVVSNGGINAGIYPVTIALSDAENYKFSEIDTSVYYTDFEIERAENHFTEQLRAYDVFEGTIPSPSAAARFGEVEYLYASAKGGEYSYNAPLSAGHYCVIAKVSGTENYTEIVSAAVYFSVIGEYVMGAAVKEMPYKTNYQAFETFDLSGLLLVVTYNSGKNEIISADKLSVSYQSGDTFAYGHTAVTVSYLGFGVSVPVTVEKRVYDTSSIVFNDATLVYNGSAQSISYSGVLPVGLDGIPLECSVLGSGINAGVYSIILVFSSESKNYVIPPSMKAELTISPYESAVVWSGLWFVYDGSIKCPQAYYLDIYGRKHTLSVSGANYLAGEYTVLASASDSNYKLFDASVNYTIAKADYDFSGVEWTSSDFVYDGIEKQVVVSGLPDGVKVIGYIDNKAVFAGEYVAKAVLSFDEKNYNTPPEVSLVWKIARRDYDVSSFEFFDTEAIFDNEAHYPTFSGVMPVGKDGIALTYSFDKKVVHVSEGRVAVRVDFYTKSENYNTPQSLVRYVQILPFGINIIWQNLSFVYDGSEKAPSAVSNLTALSVSGKAVGAGVYTAVAVALNSDYFIVNSEVEFAIEKAPNTWVLPLSVSDVFEGNMPSPTASALAGNVEYMYFSDSELTTPIKEPEISGVYYVIAVSDGDENYLPIVSTAVAFRVVEVVPVAFFVTLFNSEFIAFQRLLADDFIAEIKNNDGSVSVINFDNVNVIYENADSLRYGDNSVVFSYLGFSFSHEISVIKADYDMNGAVWSNGDFKYDGSEKSIYLSGLPEGVSVISYVGNSVVKAGKYTVSVTFSFDEENYNPPEISLGVINIEKQIVPLPHIQSLVYTGFTQLPDISDSELFKVSVSAEKSSGVYFAELALNDSENYMFPDGSKITQIPYEILPRTLSVVVSSVDKYLFEKLPTPEYHIVSGSVLEGDTLSLSFFVSNGFIYCLSDVENYTLVVTPGEIIEHNTLSAKGFLFLFLLLLIIVSFSLVSIVLLNQRRRRHAPFFRSEAQPFEEIAALSQKIKRAENFSIENTDIDRIMTVSPERADTLITDSLAKSLLRKGGISVYTDGSKKGIINVDVLSSNFTAGDNVDVNLLKQKNLIPYDTAYIKVLARGIIDKPLKVYANEFSLSAVKMIALTGGEAIRVTTVRKKARNKEENSL